MNKAYPDPSLINAPDPRGYEAAMASGYIGFIGGPRDGERWPITQPAPRHEGGGYVYANQIKWAYVWVPDCSNHRHTSERSNT